MKKLKKLGKNCLECGSTEYGFLTGMREDCKADRSIRDALDCRDDILALAIGGAGVDYDDAAWPDDECDVCGAAAIFRGDLASAS